MERKHAKRWVSLTVVLVLLMTTGFSVLLAGCTKKDAMDAPIDLTPTNELVLYVPLHNQVYLNNVVRAYTRMYPDVNVIVESFEETSYFDFDADEFVSDYGEVLQAYNDRMNTELNAGKGPDVLFLDRLRDFDPYRAADAGVLLNLSEILKQDDSFNREDYFEWALDAGVYKGKQYVIPYFFPSPVSLSSAAAIDETGLDLSKNTDLSSFMQEMVRSAPIVEENIDPSVEWLWERKWPRDYNYLFSYSGLELIDYQSKKALPDEKEFRVFCEDFKSYYEKGSPRLSYGSGSMSGDPDGQGIYVRSYDLSSVWYEAALLETEGEFSMSTIPGTDGKLHAVTGQYAGINSSSKNQLNAYNFIKLMISPELQISARYIGLPVHKESFKKLAEIEWNINDSSNSMKFSDGQGNVLRLTKPSEQKLEEYIDLVMSVDDCSLTFDRPINSFEYMEPYFKGEKSYDECAEKLKSRLTLYVSE